VLAAHGCGTRLRHISTPRTTPPDKKDVIQAFAIIVAGVVGAIGAIVGLGGLYFSRKTLHQQRDLEEQSAQDDALTDYFAQMGELLLDKDRPLRCAKPGDSMRTVAGAQTLTMLARLDADRKRRVLQFLYDSNLIKSPGIINLFKARLINANLVGAYLPGVDLSNTVLRRANLKDATLNGSNLHYVNLREANVEGAKLEGANLSDA
jgi:hypothetical protein